MTIVRSTIGAGEYARRDPTDVCALQHDEGMWSASQFLDRFKGISQRFLTSSRPLRVLQNHGHLPGVRPFEATLRLFLDHRRLFCGGWPINIAVNR